MIIPYLQSLEQSFGTKKKGQLIIILLDIIYIFHI